LRPTRPLAQPACLPRCPRRLKPPRPAHLACTSVVSSREYVFPFGSRLLSWPPLPCLSDKRAPAVSSVPHLQPPELAHVATASRPLSAAQPAPRVPPSRYHLAFISPPLIPLLNPPPPSMALKPLTPALTPPRPPLPSTPLTPIKGEHHPLSSPHLSQPLFSSLHARAFLSPSAAASGSAPPSPGLQDAA
jgi:hypothetical protein